MQKSKCFLKLIEIFADLEEFSTQEMTKSDIIAAEIKSRPGHGDQDRASVSTPGGDIGDTGLASDTGALDSLSDKLVLIVGDPEDIPEVMTTLLLDQEL